MAVSDAHRGAGSGLPTRFAPAERLQGLGLAADLARAAGSPVVEAMLRAMGTAVLVVNEHRQVVAANTAALDMLGVEDATRVLGLRPGEAVDCVHAHEEPGGCGTAQACATCGAVLAMVVAMKRHRPEERKCAITARTGGGTTDLDLLVRAVPFQVDGRELVMLAISDVSQESRHAALERAFLHDINNVLTGLVAAADDLTSADPREVEEAASDVRLIVDRLVREVKVQRVLSSAVLDDYRPNLVPVQVAKLCEDLARLFNRHPAATARTLEVTPPERRTVQTDPFLLARILTNMLKNAFEATPARGSVRLSVRDLGDAVRFEVHNPGAIPAAVIPHLFQRHFTTKPGAGRGEGTWSMKSLGEQILGGRVGFDTDREAGTTFWFRLPAPRAEP